MNIGVKHSLCLISMLSKTQPSESMPMKKGFAGVKAFSACALSLIVVVGSSRIAPHRVKQVLAWVSDGWFSGGSGRHADSYERMSQECGFKGR